MRQMLLSVHPAWAKASIDLVGWVLLGGEVRCLPDRRLPGKPGADI